MTNHIIDNVQTLKAYIESAFNSISTEGKIYLGAKRTSIDVFNDTYTCNFVWVLGDGADPSEIPTFPEGELPLKEGSDITINPSFSVTTDHPDYVLHDSEPAISLGDTFGENEMDEGNFDILQKCFNEVHLSEEQFVDLIEGDTEFSKYTALVSVYQSGTKFDQAKEVAGDLMGHETVDEEDANLQFMISIQAPRPDFWPIVGGMTTEERFAHVRTVTLDGSRYPVAIKMLKLFSGEEIADGQVLYTGEIITEHGEKTPEIGFEEELDKIDWAAFLSSNKAWPSNPGLSSGKGMF